MSFVTLYSMDLSPFRTILLSFMTTDFKIYAKIIRGDIVNYLMEKYKHNGSLWDDE